MTLALHGKSKTRQGWLIAIAVAMVTFAALAGGALLGGGDARATGTVVVKPSSMNGWQIVPDGTVPYAFVQGPAALGSGSLQFGPIAGTPGANKFIMYPPYSGLVSDLTSLSYDFFIDSASAGGAQNFYVNVYVDDSLNGIGTFAGTGWYDCRYDSVPTTGLVNGWTTHSFTQSSTWTVINNRSGGCAPTLAGIAAGSRVMFVAINGGQSTSADAGLKGGFDNVVVISTTSGTTTYDFEPETACTTVCYVNAATGNDAFGGDTPTSAKKTIQAAVNQVTATGTVHVAAGTYPEQVVITKNLHLLGAGSGLTIITAPTTIPAASNQDSAVVKIAGAGVAAEIAAVTVSGPGPSGCGSIGFGIFVLDSANANIHDNSILDVRDQPFSGCQNGVGIQVGRNLYTTAGTATITNNSITGFQKNGITVDGPGSAAVIASNVVTGSGPTTIIAQNGIQISRGATAQITGNTVSGNDYTPTSYDACGILYYLADGVKQSKNTLFNNERDICNFGRGGGQFNLNP